MISPQTIQEVCGIMDRIAIFNFIATVIDIKLIEI